MMGQSHVTSSAKSSYGFADALRMSICEKWEVNVGIFGMESSSGLRYYLQSLS